MTCATVGAHRLRPGDLARLSTVGIRTRKLRAALSALGIAIGVAAIVAVLGLSSSSQAGLLNEIDQLGTNLLTVANGQTLSGETAELPTAAPAMISRIGPVTAVDDTGRVNNVNAYRSDLVPTINSNALSVQATSLTLPATVGTSVAQGRFLNPATAHEPVVVLGALAAGRLGIDRVYPGERICLRLTHANGQMSPACRQWFYLAGILNSATLAPEIDTSVLIGYPAAQTYLGFDGHPSQIYLRAHTSQVNAVHDVLAATAWPEHPNQVTVARPSDALVARAAAHGALNSLFLGLGAVSLLVGAIGIGNVMLIGVLERRSEIGLRRALGATKGHIRTQFLSEAMLLALLGGAVGVGLGTAATAVYAHTQHWAIVIPAVAWAGGLASALVIGAVAGLLPAIRAAHMSPTQALWAV
jgi:putative ABC transport system permease protein